VTEAADVAARFDLPGDVDAVEPHPTGHINDGYLVVAGAGRYLLQRLNPLVFPDPEAVMANIGAVTDHLRAKGEPTLTLATTRDGATSWRDAGGATWRMYDYVRGVHPLEVRSPADAAMVGRTFGRFHRLLADVDVSCLRVSMPGFHDPARRMAQLEAAVEADSYDRLGDVGGLVDALRTLRHAIAADSALASLPVRVAHNDAKAANLLVDAAGAQQPVVIDLDTVMPGGVLWDVGDMVRSTTGTPEEATTAVSFHVDRYHALVDAWLAETGDLLTQPERDAVPEAGPVVTFEQAVRFLTDHLQGDVYFRATRPGENLDRARNQMELARSMVANLDRRQ
jgi:Ser/Thr protein kinase RdoA (MazF antagonist)